MFDGRLAVDDNLTGPTVLTFTEKFWPSCWEARTGPSCRFREAISHAGSPAPRRPQCRDADKTHDGGEDREMSRTRLAMGRRNTSRGDCGRRGTATGRAARFLGRGLFIPATHRFGRPPVRPYARPGLNQFGEAVACDGEHIVGRERGSNACNGRLLGGRTSGDAERVCGDQPTFKHLRKRRTG